MKHMKRKSIVLAGCILLASLGIYGQPHAQGTGIITGSNVNVRAQADVASSQVTRLNKQDVTIVSEKVTGADGKNWYKVNFIQNGKNYNGYIRSDFVNYQESTSQTNAQTTAQTTTNTSATGTSQNNTSSQGTTTSVKGNVKAVNVNVRQSAVTGNVLATLAKGTKVTYKKEKKGSDGKTWYYISFKKDGKTTKGWIRSDFVTLSGTTAGTNTQNPTGVSTSANTNNAISSDTSVTASNSTASSQTTERKGKVTADRVNIRDKEVSGKVISVLNKGTALTYKKKKKASDGKNWYYVSFDLNGKTKKGWICSTYVKLDKAQTTETPAADPAQNTSSTNNNQTQNKTGQINAKNVNIRKSPVTGNVVCMLSAKENVTIAGDKKGSDGKTWYKIKFTYQGKSKTGYVRSDFVTVNQTQAENETPAEQENPDSLSTPLSDEEFESALSAQGFPESYKASLRKLHTQYPNWVFKAVQTGLEWETVVKNESVVGRNFVPKNAICSWKSTDQAAYNAKTNTWYGFDGGSWVAASSDIIRYYLDPRNFLDEKQVFQFESLNFENYQSVNGVKQMLSSSFMNKSFTEPDGTVATYEDTFFEAGKKYGINPYHLAARCYQEQGKGTSDCISGKFKGYENYFNYFNIGAYACGNNSPVKQGLIYASSSVNSSLNFGRPWNTRTKSLYGGAEYISKKFISVGQNTLYFQKFNVVNKTNGLYKHQYMTNLQAAASEAIKMDKAYADNKNINLVFYIPVYTNMPSTASVRPDSTFNPNNMLKSLSVKNATLSPKFDANTDAYIVQIPEETEKIEISAQAVTQTSTITGTGTKTLSEGDNAFEIICTSQTGVPKKYTIVIQKKSGNEISF